MDAITQDIDDQAYGALRARATLEGRPVSEMVNEAIRGYLMRTTPSRGKASLRALQPESYPEGNECLSTQLDSVLYGVGR